MRQRKVSENWFVKEEVTGPSDSLFSFPLTLGRGNPGGRTPKPGRRAGGAPIAPPSEGEGKRGPPSELEGRLIERSSSVTISGIRRGGPHTAKPPGVGQAQGGLGEPGPRRVS